MKHKHYKKKNQSIEEVGIDRHIKDTGPIRSIPGDYKTWHRCPRCFRATSGIGLTLCPDCANENWKNRS